MVESHPNVARCATLGWGTRQTSGTREVSSPEGDSGFIWDAIPRTYVRG